MMIQRRPFVRQALAATTVLGCGAPSRARESTTAPPLRRLSTPPPPQPTERCVRTEPNIEGPFFRSGSPDISSEDGSPAGLVRATHPGVVLELTGRVVGLHCIPLVGARMEVWQADEHGAYDNDGQRFRGHFVTDAAGNFALRTIVPGHYEVQGGFRPAHVHVKVLAQGRPPLTTQLYFAGDPYNDGDPFIRPSLIMPLVTTPSGVRCRHEFVI